MICHWETLRIDFHLLNIFLQRSLHEISILQSGFLLSVRSQKLFVLVGTDEMVQGHEDLTLRVFFAYIITTLYPQKELLNSKMGQRDFEKKEQFVESTNIFRMKNFSKQSTSGCRNQAGGERGGEGGTWERKWLCASRLVMMTLAPCDTICDN